MRVVVVDDSAFMRRAVQNMLSSDPDIEIAGIGRNGLDAVELAKKLQPDVMTLDIEMPQLDGLSALRRIMREAPTKVVMVSSLTTEGSVASLQALRMGAADFIAKDHSQVSLNINSIRDELVRKVKAIGARVRPADAPPRIMAAPPVFSERRFDAVLIGSSTGGPPVLETLLAGLSPSFEPPVIIAQHMPALFTRSMAERFSQLTPLRVRHATDGMPVERKTIYVAEGGKHLHIRKAGLGRYSLHVSDEPVSEPYRPSVDVLLETGATCFGSRCLGIVLTGIGDDGLEGARKLHAAGGELLAQSAETCVVYGMPRAVTQAGLVTASLAPADMVRALATCARPIIAA